MHSSAFGAAARIAFRSPSRTARCSALTPARYSSIVFGFAAMACSPQGCLWRTLPRFRGGGVEKLRDRCQQPLGAGPDHEVIPAREDRQLRVGDEPKHLHRVLQAHQVVIALRDEDGGLDGPEVFAREA